jgi:hypothetical protein
MKLYRSRVGRFVLLLSLMASLTILSSKIQADTGSCGGGTITLPFNDVMASPFFCQIAAAYFSGLTNGTGDGTTYSPTQTVTREQMAAFITRTMDQSLKRGSQRAVTKKWWTPQNQGGLALTDVGDSPRFLEFDGTDLWVPNTNSGTINRVRPSDGKVIETWTGATSTTAVLCAMGKIFATGQTIPSRLYMIDPTQPAGAVTTLTNSLPDRPIAMAFDGERIWFTDLDSVSIVTLNPLTVTPISTGFNRLAGILYDGANIWVADEGADTLLKLNSDGSIAQTVNVGDKPRLPVFDGTNIWVPNEDSNSLSVVRVKDAAGNPLTNPFVLATLTGNGLLAPLTTAFDGERILVASALSNSFSIWKAADLTPLGSVSTGPASIPIGACSDGLNFWITLNNLDKLARF